MKQSTDSGGQSSSQPGKAETLPPPKVPVTTPVASVGEEIDYRGHKVIKGLDYDFNRKISIGTARDNHVLGSLTVRAALEDIKTGEMRKCVQRARDAAEDIAAELWGAVKDFHKTGRFDLDRTLAVFSWMPWETFNRLPNELTQLYVAHNLREKIGHKQTEDAFWLELKKISWRHAKVWKLPAFMWTGVFGVRTENGLMEPSGVLCVDFDRLVENIDTFMAKLRDDPLIMAAMRSPSFTGVKVLVRIPDDAVSDPVKFRACFETIQRYIEENYPGVIVSVDKAAKARDQLCFYMHDPESFYFGNSYILLPDPDLLENKAAAKTRPTSPNQKKSATSARAKQPGQERDYPPAEWTTVKSALESLESWLTGLQDGERYGTWTGLCFSVGHWARLSENETVKSEAKEWLLSFAERIYGNHAAALANAFDRADGQKTIGSLFALAKEHGWTPPWQNTLSDPRPKIQLPGANRLLSDFAAELAGYLRDEDIFVRNGEVCVLKNGALKPLKAQTLRTWCEQHVLCYQQGGAGGKTYTFKVTMDNDDAVGSLDSPQFRDGLRPVRRVYNARLPVFGQDGKLALLPSGYDADSQTLTLSSVEYDIEMSLEVARQTINDLLAEFVFAETAQTDSKESKPTIRSKAVAVAAMVGLYANALLPDNSLRPAFIICANAEGAGKGTLAKCCMVPAIGSTPTSSKPKEEDEMRKTLLTAVREAKIVIFFDNLKGHLSSDSLEAFLTATVFEGRKLGVNEYIVAPNLATVFITGNGLTVSPDLRRRSLFVELHLAEERAEDKVFKRPLDDPTLLALRPKLLAALWALAKHWDSQGRSAPSRSHSAFPSWANIIGGIVEAGGFGCPFERADVAAAADPDGDDMRSLVSAMAQLLPAPGKRAGKTEWTFGDLLVLAQEQGLFENLLGAADDNLEMEDHEIVKPGFGWRRDGVGRREKSTLSRVLLRYDRRLVSGEGRRLYRFTVKGKGHARRYAIERQEEPEQNV